MAADQERKRRQEEKEREEQERAEKVTHWRKIVLYSHYFTLGLKRIQLNGLKDNFMK